MRMKDVYSKKITSEEEQGGYVIVLKDRLSFFPTLGRRFQMIQNGRSRRAMVESYPCSCRGPEFPHSHFFIRVKALKSGDRVTIRKDSKSGPRYLLQVQAHPRRNV
ncbi:hypothetical protein E6H19_09040 [Candidatus Bathyarchaeota archaeon]|nr:MAG: hypothetical protein E6H19_09040 [Candidatus Bathyarchaeota archaeon]